MISLFNRSNLSVDKDRGQICFALGELDLASLSVYAEIRTDSHSISIGTELKKLQTFTRLYIDHQIIYFIINRILPEICAQYFQILI